MEAAAHLDLALVYAVMALTELTALSTAEPTLAAATAAPVAADSLLMRRVMEAHPANVAAA